MQAGITENKKLHMSRREKEKEKERNGIEAWLRMHNTK
jgi:hypothetical protein